MKIFWKRYTQQLILVFFIGMLVSCINEGTEDQGVTTKVKEGDNVPQFVLCGSDGKETSSSSLNGRVYILSFFDTGCPDCQQELEVLQRIYDRYHTVLPVLNVPRSQTKDEVQAYWNKAGLSMPFHIASNQSLYYQFATRIVPRTYVVDDNGKVCAAFADSPIADFETLDALLSQKMNEANSRRGSVNLSLRVKVPAAGGDINDYYFHNEYTISRLDIYFFDAATKVFFKKAVLSNLTKDESVYDTEYDITYLFDNLRFRAGIYDIFLVANYDNSPGTLEYEDELINMIDSITYKDGIEANIPDKGPVMTNRATSLLDIDLIPWIDKTYKLNIELERVVAKLQIGVSQNSFQLSHNGKKYADINLTNYKLVNLNRQYYLFQHKDSLPSFTSQPEFALPTHFSDYDDEGEQYVVDPFFYLKNQNVTNAAAFAYYYKSWFGNFTTEDFASMPSANNHGYAYILENTSYKAYQKNGYSPGVVFKAAVSPVFVYLYDYSKQILKEEYRPEYWPKTLFLYKYNFYGSIQAVNVAGGLALDELQTYTDEQLKDYGIKQVNFNMGVYETFYTYWIHHRNNANNPIGAMEYGVVRNNFYKMVVSGVNGIGHSRITPDIMRDNYPNSYVDIVVD